MQAALSSTEQRLQKLQNGGSLPGHRLFQLLSPIPAAGLLCGGASPMVQGSSGHMREPAQLPLPSALSGTSSTEGSSPSREEQSSGGAMLRAFTQTKNALESIPEHNYCSPIIPPLCPLPWSNRPPPDHKQPHQTLLIPFLSSKKPRHRAGEPFTGIVGTPFPSQHVGSYTIAFPQIRNCMEGFVQNSMEGKKAALEVCKIISDLGTCTGVTPFLTFKDVAQGRDFSS